MRLITVADRRGGTGNEHVRCTRCFSGNCQGSSGQVPGSITAVSGGAEGCGICPEGVGSQNPGPGVDVIAMDSEKEIGSGFECRGGPEGGGQGEIAAFEFGTGRAVEEDRGVG